jgi:transcriptional regulator of acetoin/glycerol metabolism
MADDPFNRGPKWRKHVGRWNRDTSNRILSARLITDPNGVIREVQLALQRSHGVIADAAERLGVSRRTLFRWIERFPTMKNPP